MPGACGPASLPARAPRPERGCVAPADARAFKRHRGPAAGILPGRRRPSGRHPTYNTQAGTGTAPPRPAARAQTRARGSRQLSGSRPRGKRARGAGKHPQKLLKNRAARQRPAEPRCPPRAAREAPASPRSTSTWRWSGARAAAAAAPAGAPPGRGPQRPTRGRRAAPAPRVSARRASAPAAPPGSRGSARRAASWPGPAAAALCARGVSGYPSARRGARRGARARTVGQQRGRVAQVGEEGVRHRLQRGHAQHRRVLQQLRHLRARAAVRSAPAGAALAGGAPAGGRRGAPGRPRRPGCAWRRSWTRRAP